MLVQFKTGMSTLYKKVIVTEIFTSSTAATPSSTNIACNAGFYRDSSNSNCIGCPANSYCPAGSTAPTSCPAEYISEKYSAEITHCIKSTTTSTTTNTNTACNAGFYHEASSNNCLGCPANSYCPAGSTAPIACQAEYISGKWSAKQDDCSYPTATTANSRRRLEPEATTTSTWTETTSATKTRVISFKSIGIEQYKNEGAKPCTLYLRYGTTETKSFLVSLAYNVDETAGVNGSHTCGTTGVDLCDPTSGSTIGMTFNNCGPNYD